MIVVSHELFLRDAMGERTIGIVIYKPDKRANHWACRYVIGWPEGESKSEGFGHDALQALMLTCQKIGAEIYSSSYHREGRLRAYEQEAGYGFPVPSSLRDMLVGVDAI
jgi:hypothetical protein